MYPWYYVWSDLYKIFHEVLRFGARDISGVSLRPICVPQHIFTRKTDDLQAHFLTGIAIKIHCICKILEGSTDPYIIFSDADLILNDRDLMEKLKDYEGNDITAMKDLPDSKDYNIGFMLLKNTVEVRTFFQRVLKKTVEEKKLDQYAFNEEIQTFSGTHGFFDTKYFIQSNMIRKDIWDMGNYSVIQCLSSEHSSMKDVMLGKLMTIVFFYDIRHLLHWVDRATVSQLQEDLKAVSPTHYLCSLNLDEIYSATEELPKNA
jgi:hypothetical protein